MNLVYLTSDAANSKPRTLRAIRAAMLALGSGGSLDDAFRAYDDLLADGEVLLGSGDVEAAKAAASALAHDGATYRIENVEVEHDDHEPEAEGLIGKLLQSQPEPSGNEPSFTASKCAMIVLHAVDGNPTYALSIARAIGRVTNDTLWNEVEDVILESFPPARVR
jgi:hypothetical protein